MILVFAATLAGIIASIAGFGIGSLLTPTLASFETAKLAVAAVSIPHLLATSYRFWIVRKHIDISLLKSFGVMSAAGGLLGAVANYYFASRGLALVLAALLFFVGFGGLFGWTKRLRFEGIWAWIAGGVSGFLGGLVGNQGGLRAGAMMGLGVSRDAFVATATATGLIVDLARMPVYVISAGPELYRIWPAILLMSVGALVGTFLGMKVLKGIPEKMFNTTVSLLLIALGLWLIFGPQR
jgi:uncharacterized protein